jgi:hypothetical protein
MKTASKAIPPPAQERLRSRVEQYARENLPGRYTRIEVSFRGAKAYIDLYREPEPPFGQPVEGETAEQQMERLRNLPQHVCRLDYLGSDDQWRFAFYSSASEKYERSFLLTGSPVGTPEEVLATSTIWL